LLYKLNEHKRYVVFSYLAVASNIITAFILFPLILENIGLDALGVFGLLFSIKSIVDIGIGWLSSSMTKNLINYKYLVNNILSLSFIINIVYGVIAFFIVYIYGYFTNYTYINSFFYFYIFIFISFSIIPFYEMMLANLKQSQVAFFRFFQQFLFMIFSIASFKIIDAESLDIVFISLLIASIINFLLIFRFFIINFRFKFTINKAIKKILHKLFINDGISYFINGVSTILLLQIDVLLIDYFYGLKSVGIYLIIWKIPNTLIMLGWRLSEPFSVVVANGIKEYNKEIKNKFFNLEKKIFFAAIILALSYIIFGRFVLEFWLGSENIVEIKYMYIMSALVIFFSVLQRFYLSVNYYTSGLNLITILQFIEVSFKILFTILFFNNFNELAPIVGWLFAFIFTFYFYRKNALKVLIMEKI